MIEKTAIKAARKIGSICPERKMLFWAIVLAFCLGYIIGSA